jgi:hypothetical protein
VTGFDADRVAYHVRRLDAEGLAALVADLWEARGYETTRDGSDVLARGRDGSVRVRVAPGGGVSSDGAADVVVAPGGDDGDGDSVRTVDAAGVAKLLGYAVGRQAARDICDRHLGAPPADLPPPLSDRLRERAGALAPAAPAVLGIGALAAVLVIGVGGVTVTPGPTGESLSASDPGTVPDTSPLSDGHAAGIKGIETDSEEGGQPGPSMDRSGDGTPPPGVSESGIEDVDALAATHERAVANRSHTLWVDWYRPRNLRANGTRVKRDIDIASEGGRYLVETGNEVGGERTRSGAIYNDGTGLYVATWNETDGSYGRVFRITPRQNNVPTPESVRARLVTRYLSTPRTNVTGVVERDGRRLYRVVGTGPPNTTSAVTIRNYTVEALIDSRGFVRDVTVRASLEHPDTTPERAFRVKREMTYGRVGSTTVEPPGWYLNHTRGDSQGS